MIGPGFTGARSRHRKMLVGFAILAAGCLSVSVHAQDSDGEHTAPVPIDPGSWVSALDYPPRALRENVEGTTGFRLTVSPDGRVRKCEVTVSSGSNDLDEATCALATERARFQPFDGASGSPRTFTTRVQWEIPKGSESPPAPSVPFDIAYSFVVDADGRMSDCVDLSTKPLPPGATSPCDQINGGPHRTYAAVQGR